MTPVHRVVLTIPVVVAAAVLVVGCSSGATSPATPPSSATQTTSPKDAARTEYIKTLKDQAVRYRSETDAYAMADDVCKDLESTTVSKSQSGREQWTHSMLVLHRDLSSRDATILITAVQNSKMCSVK